MWSSSFQGKKLGLWVVEYLHRWCGYSRDNTQELKMEKLSPFSLHLVVFQTFKCSSEETDSYSGRNESTIFVIEHCDVSLPDHYDIYESFFATATAGFNLI